MPTQQKYAVAAILVLGVIGGAGLLIGHPAVWVPALVASLVVLVVHELRSGGGA
jgi:hypothetical protein